MSQLYRDQQRRGVAPQAQRMSVLEGEHPQDQDERPGDTEHESGQREVQRTRTRRQRRDGDRDRDSFDGVAGANVRQQKHETAALSDEAQALADESTEQQRRLRMEREVWNRALRPSCIVHDGLHDRGCAVRSYRP